MCQCLRLGPGSTPWNGRAIVVKMPAKEGHSARGMLGNSDVKSVTKDSPGFSVLETSAKACSGSAMIDSSLCNISGKRTVQLGLSTSPLPLPPSLSLFPLLFKEPRLMVAL